jgi:hypothetical protein
MFFYNNTLKGQSHDIQLQNRLGSVNGITESQVFPEETKKFMIGPVVYGGEVNHNLDLV